MCAVMLGRISGSSDETARPRAGVALMIEERFGSWYSISTMGRLPSP